MLDPVLNDESKYQRDLCDHEARQDAIYDARDHLAQCWRNEYNKRGVVDYFGGDPKEELEIEESLGELFDRWALLEVTTYPEKYIPDWNGDKQWN